MSDSLEFRLLKYILAVAETLNFTRAAQRLFLAQPSLSKQIRDLEIDIKFPLFERGRDGIRITDAGRIVIAYASNTLRERDEMLAMARAVHLGVSLRYGSASHPSSMQTYCKDFANHMKSSTEGGVYRSKDNGVRWQELKVQWKSNTLTAHAIDMAIAGSGTSVD
jgi:hypothetical protein